MVVKITKELIQSLRASTGAGIMDCKNALQSVDGNLEAAIEAMRKKGKIQAERKSACVAAEGLIVIKQATPKGDVVILEINCQTDFVSRDENFRYFSEQITQLAVDNHIESVEALLATFLPYMNMTVESAREALILKLDENIQIRRLALIRFEPGITIGMYLHVGCMGAVVQLKGGAEQLANDLAVHVVANNPLAIFSKDLSDGVLAKEKEIIEAQTQISGKPPSVIKKMVEGRLEKFCNEVTLLGQPFIKNPDITVGKLLEKENAEIISFIRFAVGDDIEKQSKSFSEAV